MRGGSWRLIHGLTPNCFEFLSVIAHSIVTFWNCLPNRDGHSFAGSAIPECRHGKKDRGVMRILTDYAARFDQKMAAQELEPF